jgi:hypothetical protein
VDKSGHRFREVKTIGVSSDEKEISELYLAGKKWIIFHCMGQEQDMFEIQEEEEEK